MILPACASSSINVLRCPSRFSTVVFSKMPNLSSSSVAPISTETTTTPTTTTVAPISVEATTTATNTTIAPISTEATTTTTTTTVEKPKPWLIVGLGNPGKKYNGTRHNVGFEMLDAIAESEGISMSSVSFKALFGKGSIGNVPVILAKPQTFMNVSGESVGPIVSYYKIPLKQVLVVFDDLDIPFASLRLLPKGGHGGHNGMRSIIQHFKDNREFPRLKIGIGRPPGRMDAASFVLRPFSKQERQELEFTLQEGVEAVRLLLLEGFNKSATRVNSKKTLKQLS